MVLKEDLVRFNKSYSKTRPADEEWLGSYTAAKKSISEGFIVWLIIWLAVRLFFLSVFGLAPFEEEHPAISSSVIIGLLGAGGIWMTAMERKRVFLILPFLFVICICVCIDLAFVVDGRRSAETWAESLKFPSLALYAYSLYKVCVHLFDLRKENLRIQQKLKSSTFEQQTLSKDGVNLWIETWGDPKNECCLLISPEGASARFWNDKFCTLLDLHGFFVVRYDQRHTGLSSSFTSKEAANLRDLTEDVYNICEHLKLTSVHVVGYGLGGYVAQDLVIKDAGLVKTLTLIGSGPLGATDRTAYPLPPHQERHVEKTTRARGLHTPSWNFATSISSYLRYFTHLSGWVPISPSAVRQYVSDLYDRSSHDSHNFTFHEEIRRNIQQSLVDRQGLIESIKCPTLIIHGRYDGLYPLDHGGRALSEAIPQSRLLIVEDLGHMTFNTIWSDWLLRALITHFKNGRFDWLRSSWRSPERC